MNRPAHPGAGHRARLREKFLAHGLGRFNDDEVLELLLTLATPRQDCKQRARELLTRFGSLKGVLEADPAELAGVDGIGPKNILGLKLVPAVARRYLEDRLRRGGAIESYQDLADYLRHDMGGLDREVFKVLLLDGRRRLLACEDLFAGTLDQAVVFPREVVARALARGAAGVVCAHNHPSGDPRPSPDDRQLTRRLYHALSAVDLELVDHVVVGESGLYSFAQRGELLPLASEFKTLKL